MFRHEALLYRGPDGFLAGSLPYIRTGLAADEAILVAVDAPKIRSLRGALGADADRVQFADMAVLGHNPARIIPAWREFADANAGPVRGIGEPIWAGRGATELVECQLHEALLNVAFADRADFRLLCPYDTLARPAASSTRRAAATRTSTASRATRTATQHAAGAVRLTAAAAARDRADPRLRARHARRGAAAGRAQRAPRRPAGRP